MKSRTSLLLSGLAILALLCCFGCSDDDDPATPPAGNDAEETIGTAGGSVEIEDKVAFSVSQDALPGDIDFTLNDVGNDYPDVDPDLQVVAPVYSIGPSGTTFATYAGIEFQYEDDDLSGADEGDLTVYTHDGTSWSALATDVDSMDNTATAEVEHLSYFTLTVPVHDAQVTIGTAGGTIAIPDQLSLEIDAGALDGDIIFSIDEDDHNVGALPTSRMAVSPVFRIDPAGTDFTTPAALVMKYDESLLTTQSETELVIYTFEDEDWSVVSTSIDGNQDEAEADIDHLSHFCVTAPVPVVEPDEVTLSATPGITIPDGPSGGGPGAAAVSTINVTEAGVLSDLRVYLNITHSYSSDLIIKLESPTGTEINLFWIGEGGEPNTNPAGWYPDDFTPKQPLSTLFGENINGTWTLRAYDYSNQAVGTLNEWRLNLFYADTR